MIATKTATPTTTASDTDIGEPKRHRKTYQTGNKSRSRWSPSQFVFGFVDPTTTATNINCYHYSGATTVSTLIYMKLCGKFGLILVMETSFSNSCTVFLTPGSAWNRSRVYFSSRLKSSDGRKL